MEHDFTAAAPNQLWVADIYFLGGLVYLAVVVDAFSRKVVAAAVEHQLRRSLPELLGLRAPSAQRALPWSSPLAASTGCGLHCDAMLRWAEVRLLIVSNWAIRPRL